LQKGKKADKTPFVFKLAPKKRKKRKKGDDVEQAL